jgi:isopenicillin N synthase-like dioxygenase
MMEDYDHTTARNTATTNAMPSSSSSIPVIDLSNGDESVVVEQLMDAFTTIGFCTLIRHGIPQNLIDDAFRASNAFFNTLSTETKLKYRYRDQSSNRGYIPFGSESHLSHTKAEQSSNSDRKETFDIGWEEEPGYANLWPSSTGNDEDDELSSCDESTFRQPLLRYFDAMDGLQLKLMRWIGMGLKLSDPNYLVDRCNGRHENLRLLHYPAFTVTTTTTTTRDGDDDNSDISGSNMMRGNPHTDFGTVTLLVQDQVGGLKVQRRDGAWLFVEPVENSIIVNVGDVSSLPIIRTYASLACLPCVLLFVLIMITV